MFQLLLLYRIHKNSIKKLEQQWKKRFIELKLSEKKYNTIEIYLQEKKFTENTHLIYQQLQ